MAAPKAPSALSRKVGPVPVWLLAALGLLAVLYLRSHRAAAAATLPAVPSAPSSPGGSAAQQPAGGAGNSADQLAPLLAPPGYVDPLTGQVQQASTTNTSSPQMMQPQATATTGPATSSAAAASFGPYQGSLVGGDVMRYSYAPASPATSYLAGSSTFGNPFGGNVGIAGTLTPSFQGNVGLYAPNVDPSGHVVNAKGARVGGVTDG